MQYTVQIVTYLRRLKLHSPASFLKASLGWPCYGSWFCKRRASFLARVEHNEEGFCYMEHISTLCKEGRLEEVFEAIHLQRAPLSKDVIFHLLQGSLKRKDIQAGRKIQSLMSRSGLFSVSILADHLIRLFALCGNLLEATVVFHKVPKPSVYTWNSIISAHVKLGENGKAIDLSSEMQTRGNKPDGVTFSCILKACGSMRDLSKGMLVHEQIIKSGVESNLVTESTLVDFYAKCDHLKEAYNVFSRMEKRDVVTWGTIIAAYTQQGDGLSALNLFKEMQLDNVKPSMVVFSSVLKACGSIQALEHGRLIHEQINHNGCISDAVLGSTLVDMYVKCGSLKEARKAFNELQIKDVVTWGTIISGYAADGHLHLAFELFDAMQLSGLIPNNVILECLLKACSMIEHIGHGKRLHCHIVTLGLNLDIHTNNVLANMYAKVGALEEAQHVFNELPCRDVRSWDNLIARHVQHGHDARVFELFNEMQETCILPSKSTLLHLLKACEGTRGCLENCMLIHYHVVRNEFESNVIIGSSLLDMYAKYGSIESAEMIFERLPNPDVVAWGAMIQGYVYQGNGHSALEVFEKMLARGIESSKVILSCISKACASLSALQHGRWVHDQVVRKGFEDDVIVGSSLVDMYAKCSQLLDAQVVFSKLSNQDATSWGAMIAGCAANGDILSVCEYFKQMQQEGIKPDKVVFSCILKACGSTGDIRQGRLICDQIIRSGLAIDIVLGNSVIDMYGKCGSLEEARKVFDGFQNRDVVSWGAMISAYAADGNSAPALELCAKMQKEGIRPNKVVFLSCLKACGAAESLLWGRLIHDQVVRFQLESDRAIGNILVDVYGKFGSSDEAQKVLDALPIQDVVSWASMISCLSQNGKAILTRQCLEEMQKQGLKPVDNTNYVSMLSACTHAGLLKEGVDYFGDMSEDHVISPTLERFSCMIDLLGRTGCQREAEDLIQTMPVFPDIVAWTSLLTSCKTFGNSNFAGDTSHIFSHSEKENQYAELFNT